MSESKNGAWLDMIWTPSADGRHLHSDDFGNDVRLDIDGDWESPEQRIAFTSALADRLNDKTMDSFERSSAADAAHYLLTALDWKEGGLGAAAIEVCKRLSETATERDAAFKIAYKVAKENHTQTCAYCGFTRAGEGAYEEVRDHVPACEKNPAVATRKALEDAHAHYQPQIDECIKEINAGSAYALELQGLLRIAKCPNYGCLNGAIPSGDREDPDWEQCQWCYERAAALAKNPNDQRGEAAASSAGRSLDDHRTLIPSRPSPTNSDDAVTVARPTDADYAIEHAGYLATAAARLIEAVNAASEARMAVEEIDEDDCPQIDDALRRQDAAEETVSEAMSNVRGMIYEFEKRRDRALAERPLKALIPAEPSEEMVIAGFECDAFDALLDTWLEPIPGPTCKQSAEAVRGIYRAMVAAAPHSSWLDKETK